VATRGESTLPLASQAAPKTAAEQQANRANWRRVTRCSSDWRMGKSVFRLDGVLMAAKGFQRPGSRSQTNSKLQAPNPKETPGHKLQGKKRFFSPIFRRWQRQQQAARKRLLEFGTWSFSGAWGLVFGAFSCVDFFRYALQRNLVPHRRICRVRCS